MHAQQPTSLNNLYNCHPYDCILVFHVLRSCPSDAEESAALYNMACAYAQQGQGASALTCIEAILENGFNDFKTLRTDPDLAPARGPAFDALVGRYDGIQVNQ